VTCRRTTSWLWAHFQSGRSSSVFGCSLKIRSQVPSSGAYSLDWDCPCCFQVTKHAPSAAQLCPERSWVSPRVKPIGVAMSRLALSASAAVLQIWSCGLVLTAVVNFWQHQWFGRTTSTSLFSHPPALRSLRLFLVSSWRYHLDRNPTTPAAALPPCSDRFNVSCLAAAITGF
jgi:hypothetical protein